MTHFGTLRDYPITENGSDEIRGATLYGANEVELGKIEDVIFEYDSFDICYVIVDTGGWLKSKKFIVPAERLLPPLRQRDGLQIPLTKKQVESLPPLDENALRSEQALADYERKCNAVWKDFPLEFAVDFPMEFLDEADKIAFLRRTIGPSLGKRWQAFQERLRRDRRLEFEVPRRAA